MKIGQIVKVRILDINKEQKRLVVTLKQSSELSNAQKNEISKLVSGKSIVKTVVVEKLKIQCWLN